MYRYVYMKTNVYIYVYLFDNSFHTAMKVGQSRTKEAVYTHMKICFKTGSTLFFLYTSACGIFYLKCVSKILFITLVLLPLLFYALTVHARVS